MKENAIALDEAIEFAQAHTDGHFVLMKFTSNWRCHFGHNHTPKIAHIHTWDAGKTARQAVQLAILQYQMTKE